MKETTFSSLDLSFRNYIANWRKGFQRMSNSTKPSLGEYIASKILEQPNQVITSDEPLISSGLIDSFSLVDLALFVEDTFGVHIDEMELNAQTFGSLKQLAALIESRQQR